MASIQFKTFLLALLASIPGTWSQGAPCGTSDSNPHERVVGGSDATEKSWPWMGSLRTSTGRHSCGVSLISEQWAITAARCARRFATIVFGDLLLNTTSRGHVSRVFDSFVHPAYDDDTYENDVALLLLDSPVTFTDYVKPVCLSTSRTEATSYSDCWVTGWGVTPEGGSILNVMQEASVNLFTRKKCTAFHGSTTDNDVMICAEKEEGEVGTCQGDTGSALVCLNDAGAWELVGVRSWGRGCSRPESPAVYARVSSFSDYIQRTTTKEYLKCPSPLFLYARGEDECDHIATCPGGLDEEDCPGLSEAVEVNSPSYPSEYPNNQRIVWVFKTEVPSAGIRIQFSHFDLEQDYDFVSVGTGRLNADTERTISTHTGDTIPEDITTPENRIWILFLSDDLQGGTGFAAVVSSINTEDVDVADPNTCGISTFDASGRINDTGVVQAPIQDWPWMASLRDSTSTVCSATLIGRYWAITAASCIGYFSKIVLGDTSVRRESDAHQERSVTAFKHPLFSGELGGSEDIALLELSEAVDVNPSILPICTTHTPHEEMEYVRCYLLGWGLLVDYTFTDIFGTDSVTDNLTETEVVLYTDAECRAVFGNSYVEYRMLCAGRRESIDTTCLANYGAPLVCLSPDNHWHLVGTKTWSVDCALGLYTRIAHYMEYIEWKQRIDYSRCSDGSVLYAHQFCDFVVDCSDGLDEIGCDGLQIGEEYLLTSPNFPEDYPNEADITYVIPAFEDNYLFVKFTAFHLEDGDDFLYYSDRNLSDAAADPTGLTGPDIPSDIAVRSTVWFNFRSDWITTKSGFSAHITVVDSEGVFECHNGEFLRSSSVCDQLVDCSSAEDETGCEPLPAGASFPISSPSYPGDYPTDYTSTHVFIAEESLNVHVSFHDLDLEEEYDYLKVGHGTDPDDPSSVLFTISGQTLPDDIQSPGSTLWITFLSDSAVVKGGYSFTVSIKAGEPCTQFLVVTEDVQTIERHQPTQLDEQCGISLIGENANMAVRIIIQEALIYCTVGEYIVVQRSMSGRAQERKTHCGRITSEQYTAGDSVTLIDYRLRWEGHGFRITYQLVRDWSPNFRGCNHLISLRDGGPVSFSSPGYPNNYGALRRCETRILSHPGTRIQVVFHEFRLEDHWSCRNDFVKLTDLVTSQGSSQFCGNEEELSFRSTSNYLSVYFRSNFRRQYRGFYAVAREVDI